MWDWKDIFQLIKWLHTNWGNWLPYVYQINNSIRVPFLQLERRCIANRDVQYRQSADIHSTLGTMMSAQFEWLRGSFGMAPANRYISHVLKDRFWRHTIRISTFFSSTIRLRLLTPIVDIIKTITYVTKINSTPCFVQIRLIASIA